jgi:hypothetical protein
MAQKSNLPLLQMRQKQQIQTRLLPLPKDTAWMDEIFVWADENKISKEQLPRNKQALWKQTTLDLGGNQLTELHKSIGNLINLKVLILSNNQLIEVPECLRIQSKTISRLPELK